MVTVAEATAARARIQADYDRLIAESEAKGLADNARRLAERRQDRLRRADDMIRAAERAERLGVSFREAEKDIRRGNVRREVAAMTPEERAQREQRIETTRAASFLQRPRESQDPARRAEARRLVRERERREASAVALGRTESAVLSRAGVREVERFRAGREELSRRERARRFPVGGFSPASGGMSVAGGGSVLVAPPVISRESFRTTSVSTGGSVLADPNRFEATSISAAPRSLGASIARRTGFSPAAFGQGFGFRGGLAAPDGISSSERAGRAAGLVSTGFGVTGLGRGAAFVATRSPFIAVPSVIGGSFGVGVGIREADIIATRSQARREGVILSRSEVRAGRRAALSGELTSVFVSPEEYNRRFSEGVGRSVPRSVTESSRQRTGGLELASLPVPGAAAEVFGNRLVSRAPVLARRYFPVAVSTGSRIGVAGIAEGLGTYATALGSREQRPTLRNTALVAGTSFGVAGVLGGSIAASQIVGRTRQARVLSGLANIADPSEPVSDSLAGSLRSFRPAQARFSRVRSADITSFGGRRTRDNGSASSPFGRYTPARSDEVVVFSEAPAARQSTLRPRTGSRPFFSSRTRFFSGTTVREPSRPRSGTRPSTRPSPVTAPITPLPNPRTPVAPRIQPRTRTSPPSRPFVPSFINSPVTSRITPQPRPQTRTTVKVVTGKFPFATLPAGNLFGTSRGAVGARRTFGYAPSLAAIGLNIRAPRSRITRQRIFTGFEFRPLAR